MDTSAENYRGLILKIDGFIRKYYLNKIVRGSLYLLAALLTGYICVTLTEYYGNFSPAIRAVLFYGFILIQLFVFVSFLLTPLLAYFRLGKRIDHQQASFIIGRHFPEVKDKLLNALQLKVLSDRSDASNAIIESAIQQKVAELKPVPFSSAVHIGENRKYLRYALPPLFIIVLLAFTAPYILSEGTERIIHYKKQYVKKAPFRFVLLNRGRTALQGEDFTVELKLIGNEVPDAVYIEDGLNTFRIEKENVVRFRYTFKKMQQTKNIRFRGGEFLSEPFTIEVLQRPALIAADVKIIYPAYLKRPSEQTNSINDLTVPAGTHLSYRLSTKNTSDLRVYDEQGNPQVARSLGDSVFRYDLRAITSGGMKIKATDRRKSGASRDADLMSFRINVVQDEAPLITIVERKDSLDGQMAFFLGQVHDDHGFADLKIKYRILEGSATGPLQSKAISLNRMAAQNSFFQAVSASDFGVREGQDLEFFFEVRDNDGVRGPKSSKTESFKLSRPTRAEAAQQAAIAQQLTENKLKTAIHTAARIETEAKKLNRDLMSEKEFSFAQKKQVAELLEKQRELEKLLRESREESEKNRRNKEEHDPKMQPAAKKQKQIEKLLDEALDDKTRALLKSIEELMKENQKTQTQQEISKMQSGSKALQKELDRILELYKQLEYDHQLSQTIEGLKRTAAEQKKLARDLADRGLNKQQALRRQEEAAADFKALRNNLKALSDKNRELEKSHTLEPTNAEVQEISQAQAQGQQSLKNDRLAQAQKNMNEAATKMAALSSKLEKSRESSEATGSMISLRALNQIIHNLLTSSFDQEKLLNATKESRPGDPLLSSYTKTQMQIKDNMRTIADSLYSLSRMVPQIESTVHMEVDQATASMNSALEGLADRRITDAARHQRNSMTSMNNMALLLGEVRDQLEKAMKNASGKGKGSQQNLSQMIRQQEELNKNMQKTRDQLKQNGQEIGKQRGAYAVSEKMAQMAREQSIIRHALEEFNKQSKREGAGNLGNLENLAKDMEQTEAELVNKKIQLETMNRQQEILVRLLQADKSDREREHDDKRESSQGIDQDPAAIPMLQQLKKIRARETDYLKTVPPNLNSFYQLKVGDYFRSLTSK
ncbi:MAG: DUF4175 family protein [Arcticibacter sp.]